MEFASLKYWSRYRLLILSYLALIGFIFMEPIRLWLPILDNTRKMIPLLSLVIFFFTITTDPLKMSLIIFARSRLMILFLFWAIGLSVGLMLSPKIASLNYLVYFSCSIICFVSAYSFSRTMPTLKIKRFASHVTSTVSVLIIATSIISLTRYIIPSTAGLFIKILFSSKSVDYMEYDLLRNRIFPISNLDYPLAFLASYISSFNPYFQFPLVIISLIALFLSSYRGRIIIGLISFSIVAFSGSLIRKRLIILMIALAVLVSIFMNNVNFLARYSLSRPKDVRTIVDRFNYIKKAMDVFEMKPIVGVGLGNYLEYSSTVRLYSSNEASNRVESIPSYENPHNLLVTMLAETGVLGTLPFILLIIIFIFVDINIYSHNRKIFLILLPFVFSSWCFIGGSLVDWYDPHHLVYFMIARGFILGIYDKKQTS